MNKVHVHVHDNWAEWNEKHKSVPTIKQREPHPLVHDFLKRHTNGHAAGEYLKGVATDKLHLVHKTIHPHIDAHSGLVRSYVERELKRRGVAIPTHDGFEEGKHPRAEDGKFGAGPGKEHAEHLQHHSISAAAHAKWALINERLEKHKLAGAHRLAAAAHAKAATSHKAATTEGTGPKTAAVAHGHSKEAAEATANVAKVKAEQDALKAGKKTKGKAKGGQRSSSTQVQGEADMRRILSQAQRTAEESRRATNTEDTMAKTVHVHIHEGAKTTDDWEEWNKTHANKTHRQISVHHENQAGHHAHLARVHQQAGRMDLAHAHGAASDTHYHAMRAHEEAAYAISQTRSAKDKDDIRRGADKASKKAVEHSQVAHKKTLAATAV